MKSQKSQVPTAGVAAGLILTERLASNPRLPVLTRHVMTKLASGPEAAAVWKVFGGDEEIVGRVINRVRTAFELALREEARPKDSIEKDDIESVKKKAQELKAAIKASSLPGNTASEGKFELAAHHGPDVLLSVGWHSLQTDTDWMGYPLAVCDVLDWAIQLADEHMKQLPARAVKRDKKINDLEVRAFVRHLAWQFIREFGKEHHPAIAHAANCVFDLPTKNRLKARPVTKMLEKSPLKPKAAQ